MIRNNKGKISDHILAVILVLLIAGLIGMFIDAFIRLEKHINRIQDRSAEWYKK